MSGQHRALIMVREHLRAIPGWTLPAGYSFRPYRPGDVSAWARIEAAAGEFAGEQEALGHFEREFGPQRQLLPERCLFLTDPAGLAVGTATAWFDDRFQGRRFGRLHWVAVRGEDQGRGLGRALVARAMQVLARHHGRAYLTTQTESRRAVRIYFDFGFRPLVLTAEHARGWAELAGLHPALTARAR